MVRLVSLFTALLLLGIAVFLVELIDTSLSSGSLLGACVERVALGADFNVDLGLRGPCDKCVAAVAGHGRLIILGMDGFLHDFLLT